MDTFEYTIKPIHWWLTLGFAAALHSLLLISYRYDQQEPIISEGTNEIIISLKKLKNPPKIPELLPEIPQQPSVEKKIVIEKPKPIVKKTKPITPKIKPKPVPKKKEVKPSTPVVEPLIEQRKETPTKRDPQKSFKQPVGVSVEDENKQRAAIANEKLRYMTQLSIWLNKHKKYPTIARRRGLEGDVTISFTIDKNGRLLNHNIVEASSHKTLNTAAVEMLKRASPMPAVPDLLVKNNSKFEYTIPVSFKLSNN